MIFHENRLLADDSHEISYLSFFAKLVKMLQNLSSAAVVIGALRVKLKSLSYSANIFFMKLFSAYCITCICSEAFQTSFSMEANRMNPDQNCLI